jgi:hypothetical protein
LALVYHIIILVKEMLLLWLMLRQKLWLMQLLMLFLTLMLLQKLLQKQLLMLRLILHHHHL